jgi:hypothetical protein
MEDIMRSGRLALPLALAVLAAGAGPASAQATTQTVTLTWTAPSDNSSWGGSLYDIRYARFPITEENWWQTTRITVFRPHAPGTIERCEIYGLISGFEYYFAIRTMDYQGNWSGVSNVVIKERTVNWELTPPVVALAPARPNPARSVTRIGLTLGSPGSAQVEVFDTSGRRVRVLQSGVLPAGPTELVWDLTDEQGRPVRAGIYLVRAHAGEIATMRRVAVAR